MVEPLATQTTNGFKEAGFSENKSERQNPLLFSSELNTGENNGWRAAFNELTTNASQVLNGGASSHIGALQNNASSLFKSSELPQ